MEQISTLDMLKEGEWGIVREVAADHALYERLIDLGFVAGTTLSCERISPLGDPIAYGIRGSVIALRRRDAHGITIEKMQADPNGDLHKTGGEALGVIALAGNPNVGKSSLFNALTGLHQHTGNWTGKTVECAEGQLRCAKGKYRVIDLPGMYSMNPHAAEEEAARDALVGGEINVVAVVCDAGALERNLILVLQIMQTVHRPMALVLNLQREARRRGVKVSSEALERELGIPVVAAEAREGEGVDEVAALLTALCEAKEEQRERLLTPKASPLSTELLARMASDITARVSQREGAGSRRDRRLDRILTGRATGFPVMLCLLALVFWITLVGANGLSDHLMALFSWLEGVLLAAMTGAPQWLTGALVLGVFRTVGWVVSVMLPPMAIFFPLFTLLEDLGYLPRIAFNLDRGFCRCHSCGKQALTMCMGLGCNAVGVTGCRIIDSPRERRIAMLTNSMMPCNGRFPTWIALVGMFMVCGQGVLASFSSSLVIVLGIVLCVAVTMLTSRLLSATILKGTPTSFALELPPYRLPRVGQVIVRSVLDRTLLVLGRALVVAAPAGLALWLMANISVGDTTLLCVISAFLDPVGRLFGMDGAILLAFVLSLPANEIFLPIVLMIYRGGAVLEPLGNLQGVRDILLSNGWTTTTAVCVMLFLLFHWPCATTLLTIKREGGGLRWAALGALIPTAVGAILCLAVAGVARVFGST